MTMRKPFEQMGLLLGVFCSASTLSAVESARTFVFLKPEASSFWQTAKGSRMTVPVDFPDGATSATLTVRGAGYQKSYAIDPLGGGGALNLSCPNRRSRPKRTSTT